jgi:2'-5' RNA ligase
VIVAIDVAILPPPAVARRAIELSAALPIHESQGLRLGDEMPPHVTLTQQFVPVLGLDRVFERIETTIAGYGPLPLEITGPGRGRSSVWMAIGRSAAILELHRQLMDALRPFEQANGTAEAFVEGDARPGDVQWVNGFRRSSSYALFSPHITLGHAKQLPFIQPMSFTASTIAACHLGRFCSCRRVLRSWPLQ